MSRIYYVLLSSIFISFWSHCTEQASQETVQDSFTQAYENTSQNKGSRRCDLTLVGAVSLQSCCKFLPLWFDHLSKDLSINTAAFQPIFLDGCSPEVRSAVEKGCTTAGNVAVLLDNVVNWEYVPQDSMIKICVSAYEATRLPQEWVELFNSKFDAVAVSDPWLIDVYVASGVTIPVFALLPGLELDELLKEPDRTAPHKPFTFGMSGAFWDRKNHQLLLQAFAEEFGNSPDIRLRLHGRGGYSAIVDNLKDYIHANHLTNVEVLEGLLYPFAYKTFMQSLDVYALVSKAEGYSISPQEAMALGIPCVLSDNTSHKTLCASTLVRSVASDIVIDPPDYATNGGNMFDCKIEDVRQALREVYENYSPYLNKAKASRQWVQQYAFSSLKPLYLSLIKPEKVVLGTENKIEPGCLTTTSESLYRKYLSVINSSSICKENQDDAMHFLP
jgi:glycosyltransferase involved in cell wall biosynthesis